jgi:hypothetical protein
MREKLLEFLSAEHPQALPRRRAENTNVPPPGELEQASEERGELEALKQRRA